MLVIYLLAEVVDDRNHIEVETLIDYDMRDGILCPAQQPGTPAKTLRLGI